MYVNINLAKLFRSLPVRINCQEIVRIEPARYPHYKKNTVKYYDEAVVPTYFVSYRQTVYFACKRSECVVLVKSVRIPDPVVAPASYVKPSTCSTVAV